MNNNKPAILIRCDGSPSIGLGHVVRCLALAQMLLDDYEISFVCLNIPISIQNDIIQSKCRLIQISNESEFFSLINESQIVVIDGYHFNSEFQKEIKNGGAKLVCIDDMHSIHFYADIIINQAELIDESTYSKERYSNLLLGYNWVLHRKAFRQAATVHKTLSNSSTAFFTLGNSYVTGIASIVFKALDNCNGINKIAFLKGNQKLFETEIAPIITKIHKETVVYEKLRAEELCELLSNCRIAICPASVIALEACAVGIGLFCGITADNQIDNYNGLVKSNVSIGLGDLREQNADEIVSIINNFSNAETLNSLIFEQKKRFDGKSSERYISLFKSLLC